MRGPGPSKEVRFFSCCRGISIRKHVIVIELAVLFFTPLSAAGQASPDLALGSHVEWAVEKLVGFGLIDDRILAVRPWSRGEALRLFDQVRDNMARVKAADREAVESVLASVPRRELTSHGRIEVIGNATSLDSPWVPVPSDTGADRIDAEVNHLVRYRGGRDVVDGSSLAGELALEAVLGNHFSIQGRPRVRTGGGESAQLLEATGRLQVGNLRLDVGRSNSSWGPGRDGGTLLANNARGLDRVRLSSDHPFLWPGVLSFLGPSQAEFFFARLEPDRDVPHSKLVGYQISIRPHPLLEASFSTLIQSGGTGAPQATFRERLADHVLLFDWIINGGETFLFSNKATSLALRLRVPALRHSQFFAEFTLEDRGHNLKRIFWQDGAWLTGVWIPRLDRAGVLDLRLEFHHGGVRFHRHGQFTSGRTLDRRMLGMGGPDTNSGFLELSAHSGGVHLALELGLENRSADLWRVLQRPDGGIDLWEKVEDGPDELYSRGLGKIRVFGPKGREFSAGLGVERVSDSFFQAGAVRYDTIVEVQARVPLSLGN